MALTMAMNILIWGGLAALAAWALVSLLRGLPSSRTHDHESAQDILQRRYASGEIDTHTFDEMQAHLLATTCNEQQPVPVEH